MLELNLVERKKQSLLLVAGWKGVQSSDGLAGLGAGLVSSRSNSENRYWLVEAWRGFPTTELAGDLAVIHGRLPA